MAAKQPKAKSGKTKRAPKAFLVEVTVGLDGSFSYSAQGIPDASTIRLINGDTISWLAKMMGIPVPFQVEFSGFNPFGAVGQVVRSPFGPTTPLTVALPSFYRGNLIFKYTVTAGNGWSDDPVVVPVPSDGLINTFGTQVISLSIDNTGDLVVNPTPASFTKGIVTWEWAGQALDEFSLTFSNPPAGWPAQTNSQSQEIALDLETAGTSPYTIQTLTLGLSAPGTLTIS